MPSTLLGYPYASGPQPLISGCPWSGLRPIPVGNLVLKLDKNASGYAYVGLSGATTLTSGGFFLSGGGLLDGVQMAPGDTYTIPREALYLNSGRLNVFIRSDQACSGQGRLFWEAF